MQKKILILSTKNNSHSLVAEAVLNKHLQQLTINSAGIKPTAIDKNIVKLLKKENLWDDKYQPKDFKQFTEENFDLVIILSEKILKNPPKFNENTKMIYLEYEPLNENNYSEYEQLFKDIKMELIPIIRLEL